LHHEWSATDIFDHRGLTRCPSSQRPPKDFLHPRPSAVQQLVEYIIGLADQSAQSSEGEEPVEQKQMEAQANQRIPHKPSSFSQVEPECRATKSHFSEFIRYAVVATMKPDRYQAAVK
jgi:hypothetical protein